MAQPFVYPRERHRRRLAPKQYKNYKSYKKPLREEFSKQCVYCRMPDGLASAANFGVDHYRPKEKFPALVSRYANLFYACNACNSRKSDFWPSAAERGKGIFIPNPCDHRMASHVRFRGAEVRGRSVAGKWMIELLQLDHDDITRYRAAMIATVRTLERKLAELDGALRRTAQAMETADPVKRQRLQALATALERERTAIRDSVVLHTSGP